MRARMTVELTTVAVVGALFLSFSWGLLTWNPKDIEDTHPTAFAVGLAFSLTGISINVCNVLLSTVLLVQMNYAPDDMLVWFFARFGWIAALNVSLMGVGVPAMGMSLVVQMWAAYGAMARAVTCSLAVCPFVTWALWFYIELLRRVEHSRRLAQVAPEQGGGKQEGEGEQAGGSAGGGAAWVGKGDEGQ